MISNDTQLAGILNFILNKKIFCTILFLILFIPFFYFHPTRETMTCNESYVCTIEREYMGGMKFKSSFYLGKNPLIIARPKYNYERLLSSSRHHHYYHHDTYNVYVTFNGISPFRYYIKQSDSRHLDMSQELEKYKQGDYQIHSMASVDRFYLFLILILIMYIGCYYKLYEYIYLYVDSNICKLEV